MIDLIALFETYMTTAQPSARDANKFWQLNSQFRVKTKKKKTSTVSSEYSAVVGNRSQSTLQDLKHSPNGSRSAAASANFN